MGEGVVSPVDCAIAVAIPLAREAFLADLDANDSKDFAKHIARQTPGLRAEAVWDCYRPVAEKCRRLMEEISALGVTVVGDAKLSDFEALLARKKVVTLVGHWRFPPIVREDIVNLHGIVRRLRKPDSEVVQHVANELSKVDAKILDSSFGTAEAEQEIRDALAALLERLLAPGVQSYVERRIASMDDEGPPSLRLTRVLLEEAFPGEIRPAGTIELRDGLHTTQAFVQAVPEAFGGVIDLTVCNSIILGEAIKRKRRGCLVTVNEKPANLLLRLIRHKYVMRLLATAPARFTEAVNDLSMALLGVSQ